MAVGAAGNKMRSEDDRELRITLKAFQKSHLKALNAISILKGTRVSPKSLNAISSICDQI